MGQLIGKASARFRFAADLSRLRGSAASRDLRHRRVNVGKVELSLARNNPRRQRRLVEVETILHVVRGTVACRQRFQTEMFFEKQSVGDRCKRGVFVERRPHT